MPSHCPASLRPRLAGLFVSLAWLAWPRSSRFGRALVRRVRDHDRAATNQHRREERATFSPSHSLAYSLLCKFWSSSFAASSVYEPEARLDLCRELSETACELRQDRLARRSAAPLLCTITSRPAMLRSALRSIFKGSSSAKPAASVAAAPTPSSSAPPALKSTTTPATARVGPVTAAVRHAKLYRGPELTLTSAGRHARSHRTATTGRLVPAAQARRPLADRPRRRLPAPPRGAVWRAGRERARHARQRPARGPRAERCVLPLPSSLSCTASSWALSCVRRRADDPVICLAVKRNMFRVI